MEINDELYFATASPITNEDGYTCYDLNNVVDWFLVNPIVKESKYGKRYTVGYTEAVSNTELCYSKIIFDSNISNFILANYDVLGTNVYWKVTNIPANKILNKETIDEYFKNDADSMCKKINDVRNNCNIIKDKCVKKL